jgi:hypothetical protein
MFLLLISEQRKIGNFSEPRNSSRHFRQELQKFGQQPFNEQLSDVIVSCLILNGWIVQSGGV